MRNKSRKVVQKMRGNASESVVKEVACEMGDGRYIQTGRDKHNPIVILAEKPRYSNSIEYGYP